MALKEMEQPLDVQKLSPAQRELTVSLARIQQDQRLGSEAKTQQSLNAVGGFFARNPAEFTPQMAKSLAASLEAQAAYLEANRAKYSRSAIGSPAIGASTARQLGEDARVLSDNAVKISDNFQAMLQATQQAATYAGALSRQSDEQLGSKKGEYIEKLYANMSAIVDLGLENRESYNEMALAAGRSNQRAEQECRTGAAVTAGIVLTVVGMGAGGMLAHSLGVAAKASYGALAGAGTTVGISATAGAATAIAADAAMVGINEGRLISLGEAGSAAWKGAALGALAHLPVTQIAKLAHAGRGTRIAVEATAATGTAGVALGIGRAAVAAEEGVATVESITSVARAVEKTAEVTGKAVKLAKTAAHGMEEHHAEETKHVASEASSFE
jgi:hypothetical protein